MCVIRRSQPPTRFIRVQASGTHSASGKSAWTSGGATSHAKAYQHSHPTVLGEITVRGRGLPEHGRERVTVDAVDCAGRIGRGSTPANLAPQPLRLRKAYEAATPTARPKKRPIRRCLSITTPFIM